MRFSMYRRNIQTSSSTTICLHVMSASTASTQSRSPTSKKDAQLQKNRAISESLASVVRSLKQGNTGGPILSKDEGLALAHAGDFSRCLRLTTRGQFKGTVCGAHLPVAATSFVSSMCVKCSKFKLQNSLLNDGTGRNCFGCGVYGHGRENCKRVGTSPTEMCFGCGEDGHKRENCERTNQDNSASSVSCSDHGSDEDDVIVPCGPVTNTVVNTVTTQTTTVTTITITTTR